MSLLWIEQFIDSFVRTEMPSFPSILKPVFKSIDIRRSFDIHNAKVEDLEMPYGPNALSDNEPLDSFRLFIANGNRLCKCVAQYQEHLNILIDIFDAYTYTFIERKVYTVTEPISTQLFLHSAWTTENQKFVWMTMKHYRLKDLVRIRIDITTDELIVDSTPEFKIVNDYFLAFYNTPCSEIHTFIPPQINFPDTPYIKSVKLCSIFDAKKFEKLVEKIKLCGENGLNLDDYTPGSWVDYGDVFAMNFILRDESFDTACKLLALISTDKKVRFLDFDQRKEFNYSRIMQRGDGALLVYTLTSQQLCIIK